ncbi:hypothetical protein D3C73_944110 [compost metagenome]
MGRQFLFAHVFSEQQHFQFDVQCASGLVATVEQVRQRLRVSFRSSRLSTPKRLQRFGGHDPRRYAGDETFGQERAQRLVFPGLDVSRRPVIEQAESSDVLAGVGDGDRLSHLVALADPDAQLQLVIQTRTGAEGGFGLASGQGLAFRSTHIGAGCTNGRGTTVVANRHVFVVGQQRVVGTEQLANVQRVFDTHVEIGVVADFRWQVHRAVGRQWQQFRAPGFDLATQGAAFLEQLDQPLTQRNTGIAPQFEEGIELTPTSGFDGGFCDPLEQPGLKCRFQVENMFADGHATAR